MLTGLQCYPGAHSSHIATDYILLKPPLPSAWSLQLYNCFPRWPHVNLFDYPGSEHVRKTCLQRKETEKVKRNIIIRNAVITLQLLSYRRRQVEVAGRPSL